MYPDELVDPMRKELTDVGVKELRDEQSVDEAMSKEGTLLVIVNTVCGCAASSLRPAIPIALKHSKLPTQITTVFAGKDLEATSKARSYFEGYEPSSPSVYLLKDKKVLFALERHQIQGRDFEEVAEDLVSAFDKHC